VDYGNGHLAACHHPLNVDNATLARVQAWVTRRPEAADSSALPQDSGKEDAEPVPRPD
jgi:hypothetical protein